MSFFSCWINSNHLHFSTDYFKVPTPNLVNGLYFWNADNAPSAIVGLVGRKEYEQCAKDLYFFLQVTFFGSDISLYMK